MSTTNNQQGAVSVQVTTQGSEKAIETLNAALQKMGDLLSNVNLKLTANESNLLNLAKNAKALSATVGLEMKLFESLLKAQSTQKAGTAGVLVNQGTFENAQTRKAAKLYQNQYLQEFQTLIRENKKGNLERAKQLVSQGNITAADAKMAAQAEAMLATLNGNARVLRRSEMYIKAAEKLEQQLVEAKEKQLKIQRDKVKAEAEALREQKKMSTASGQFNYMQNKSDLVLLNTPYGRQLAQAAAISQTNSRANKGFRQQEIEQFTQQNSGKLMGANRRSYYNPNMDYTQGGGVTEVQRLLYQARLHEAALRNIPKAELGFAGAKSINNDLNNLGGQIALLGQTLKMLLGAKSGTSATAQSLQKLKDMQLGQRKLDNLDLSSARNLSTESFGALNKAELMLKEKQIGKELANADRAASHAKTAQNQTARTEAQNLNAELRKQLAIVQQLIQAQKDKAAADKKTALESTAKFQLMTMQEQASLNVLSNPNNVAFLQAAARKKAEAGVLTGAQRTKAEADFARLQGSGALVTNASTYYNSGATFRGANSGQVSAFAQQIKEHIAALQVAKGVADKYGLTIAQITAMERKLGEELKAVNKVLGAKRAAEFAASTAGKEIAADKAKGKLSAVNLTSATALSTKALPSVSDEIAVLKRYGALKTEISQANRAMSLARNAGDKIAEDNAAKLLKLLKEQKLALDQLTGKAQAAQKAQLKAQSDFNDLKNKTFRTNDLTQDIKNAKTLTDLEKLKLDYLTKQKKEATELRRLAIQNNDAATKTRAEALMKQYNEERAALDARAKQIREEGKVSRQFADRMTPEAQGQSFLGRMMFMKDYMLMGGTMGVASGGYTFLRDFEVALKQTQAIAQGTEQQMQGLKGAIIQVSDSSRFSAIELTEATTILAQAGFSISEIQASLESVATLATATGSSLKDSVDIVTSVMGAFKMSASTMPEVTNQITQAMNLSKLDVPKFMLATQYAGNAASDLGVTFKEMLTATAAVSNTGIRSGSTMGTGMRQLLADLTTPTEEMKKKLRDLGLTFSDVDVRINGLTGVMKNLKEAGFSTADAFGSFELRAAAYYVALSNNLDAYDEMYEQMDSDSAALRAKEIQMDSLAAQTDRMTNQFKIAADVIGRDLAISLKVVFGSIATLMSGFNGLGTSILGFTLNAAVLGLSLAGVVLALKNMGVVLVGVIAVLKGVRVAMTGVAGASTLMAGVMSLSLGPIVAVSLAIGALVTGLMYFSRASETTQKTLDDLNTRLATSKEKVEGYRSVVVELDQKVMSLSARTTSLSDDQKALAIEFDEVRDKAIELGVDLDLKVTKTVENLKAAWEQLRLEMNKEILVNVKVNSELLAATQLAERENYAAAANQAKIKKIGIHALRNTTGLQISPDSPTRINVQGSNSNYKALPELLDAGLGTPAGRNRAVLSMFKSYISSEGKSSSEDYSQAKASADVLFSRLSTNIQQVSEKLERDKASHKIGSETYVAITNVLQQIQTERDNLQSAYDQFKVIAAQTRISERDQNQVARANQAAKTTYQLAGFQTQEEYNKAVSGIDPNEASNSSNEYMSMQQRKTLPPQVATLAGEAKLLTVKIANLEASKTAKGVTESELIEIEATISTLNKVLSEKETEKVQLLGSLRQESMTQQERNSLSLQTKIAEDEAIIRSMQQILSEVQRDGSLSEIERASAVVMEAKKHLAQRQMELKINDSLETSSGTANLYLNNEKRDKFEIERKSAVEQAENDHLNLIRDARKKAQEAEEKRMQDAFKTEIKLLKTHRSNILAELDNSLREFEIKRKEEDSQGMRELELMQEARKQMDLESNRLVFTSGDRADLDERIAAEQARVVDSVELNGLMKSFEFYDKRSTDSLNKHNDQVIQLNTIKKNFEENRAKYTEAQIEQNEADIEAQDKEIEQLWLKVQEDSRKTDELSAKINQIQRGKNTQPTSYKEQLANKYRRQNQENNSSAGIYADIETSVDAVSSGFAGMVDNIAAASGSVEDFFRNFLGRTKEGKEAWREFGTGILKTMLKIMTDRITAQFMEMLFNLGKPSTALNVQSPQGGTQFSGMQSTAFNFLGMAAGAMLGGGGAAATSGMNFPSMMGTAPVAPIPMMGFAKGGKISGGLPNRDSVPIMTMAGEYVLPKHTTSFLGDSFLEGLRNKPEATMKTFANASAAMKGGKAVTQSTNVYVVSPDQVPAGMSRDDVIVTIADDINRNGPIKQLIKQVNNRA